VRAPRALRLVRDERGAAALEFALVSPMLLLIVAGTLELAQAFYIRTVLQSVVNAAGRNSSLQSGATNQSAIDTRVSHMIHDVMPKATVTFSRRNYAEFTNVGQPEDYTDTNKNGVYDTGECFIDMNGNITWDADLGKAGLGNANDVVVYTVTVSYPQWFGFATYFGLPKTQKINATTILKNQPFATQTTRTGVQICT
jgi:Flp pilus assembly protein TadG